MSMKMRLFLILPIAGVMCTAGAHAQGPFDFREAFLLESKIQTYGLTEYDPNHSERVMSMMAPSLATPMLQDVLNDPRSYQGGWLGECGTAGGQVSPDGWYGPGRDAVSRHHRKS